MGRWSLCFRVSRGACTALTAGWKALYTAGLQSSCSLPLLSPWLRWDVCSTRPQKCNQRQKQTRKRKLTQRKRQRHKSPKGQICPLPQSSSSQTCILQKFQWHVTLRALLNALAKGSFLPSYIFAIAFIFVLFQEKLLLYSYISFALRYIFFIFKDLLVYSFFSFATEYTFVIFKEEEAEAASEALLGTLDYVLLVTILIYSLYISFVLFVILWPLCV